MTSDATDPTSTAKRFLHAVAWAEHTAMWDLLSSTSRAAVLDVALRRGMDPLLAARLREATAEDHERDEFLADLLNGIRADLAGIDLDTVRCVCDDPCDPLIATVRLIEDVPAALGGPVPVGTVDLAAERGGRWSVVRVRSSA